MSKGPHLGYLCTYGFDLVVEILFTPPEHEAAEAPTFQQISKGREKLKLGELHKQIFPSFTEPSRPLILSCTHGCMSAQLLSFCADLPLNT